eukprot:GSA120T00020474001.1
MEVLLEPLARRLIRKTLDNDHGGLQLSDHFYKGDQDHVDLDAEEEDTSTTIIPEEEHHVVFRAHKNATKTSSPARPAAVSGAAAPPSQELPNYTEAAPPGVDFFSGTGRSSCA